MLQQDKYKNTTGMATVRERIEQQLLDFLRDFLEMGFVRALKRVSLTANFESDLGIDSGPY